MFRPNRNFITKHNNHIYKKNTKCLRNCMATRLLSTGTPGPSIIGTKLFTWGVCGKTSIGLGVNDRDSSYPIQLPRIDNTGYLSISSSVNTTAIVTGNGDIYMFGYSDCGQIPNTVQLNSNTNANANANTSNTNNVFLNSLFGGSSKLKKELIKEPTKIVTEKTQKFVKVSCGSRHTAAIDENGHLYTWGWVGSIFTCNALGHGRGREYVTQPKLVESLLDHKVTQVSCGEKHTLCLTSKGEIFAFGYGEHGRLGTGHPSSYPKPTKLSYFDDVPMNFVAAAKEYSFAISAKIPDDEMQTQTQTQTQERFEIPYGWGRNDRHQMGIGGGLSMDIYSCDPTPQPVNICNIVDIGLSDADVVAVDSSGVIYHWGDRVYLTPTEINDERSVADNLAEDEQIIKVDITSTIMCFVSNKGNVFTCSKNLGMKSDIFSLGQGSVEPYRLLKKVETLNSEFVTDVVCSDGRCLAVTQ